MGKKEKGMKRKGRRVGRREYSGRKKRSEKEIKKRIGYMKSMKIEK